MNIGQVISDGFEAILTGVLEFVNQFLPMDFIMDGHIAELQESIYLTLKMMVIAGVFSFIFGLIFGIVITVTRKEGILENKIIYFVIDKVINVFRSIPFVILIALLVGVSRMVVGTTIGVEGMYIPLIVGTTPFFARQIESALAEVDNGLIEASIAMGSSPFEIITRVYLKESIPSIVRGTTITFVVLLGLTAMAGQVGGGGLGNFAIRYGYQRNYVDATWATVVIILIVVSLIQGLGNLIIKKTTH